MIRLEIGQTDASRFILLFKNVFTCSSSVLSFYINFKIIVSVSMKMSCWGGIMLNLCIKLGRNYRFTLRVFQSGKVACLHLFTSLIFFRQRSVVGSAQFLGLFVKFTFQCFFLSLSLFLSDSKWYCAFNFDVHMFIASPPHPSYWQFLFPWLQLPAVNCCPKVLNGKFQK